MTILRRFIVRVGKLRIAALVLVTVVAAGYVWRAERRINDLEARTGKAFSIVVEWGKAVDTRVQLLEARRAPGGTW
jgi:hypothetical protein